ncbi:NifU N-terminal domain-containing protein [Alteribacillus iranensis]|uniref:Scaffold protein Nfu/NifU N terminal n=1 Tax=Alteribacillus iranensis TaxID=930128 RepID=A0A1I2CV49_9BACI|nr:NifU N-terminal domain-containing protein [Alteribacillus iranensis]SFE72207.1 Scaffold protein Nfu/NifU N terminal [Alteribacillus iranensis]
MELKVDQTPNPNAIKFTAQETLFEGSTSFKKGDNPDHPLAQALLEIDGVDNIFGYGDFVTVNKTMEADWEDIIPKIQEAYNQHHG